MPEPRWHARFLRVALVAALGAAGAARPCGAQAVSATSGSPEAISRIRAEFAAIEREAPGYRRTVHDLYNFSLEGGELTGFFRDQELRKLHVRLYGETGRVTEELYFSDGRLVFVYRVHELYERPMTGPIRARIEHRLYFDGGRLIRHVRTQTPPGADLSGYDLEPDVLLRSARLFAACAAAPSPDAPECTAPER